MSLLMLLLIAVALATDAFAAAVTFGLTGKIHMKVGLKIAFFFGLFQGGMTYIGWYCCHFFRSLIEPFDHWLAFLLLLAIGVNMIKHANSESDAFFSATLGQLMLISLATSIDALATGVSFSILALNILKPVLVIGSVTFFISFLGVLIGTKLKNLVLDHTKLYYLSGLILIAIAIKTLFEHLAC